jgi:hypothetical protein
VEDLAGVLAVAEARVEHEAAEVLRYSVAVEVGEQFKLQNEQ